MRIIYPKAVQESGEDLSRQEQSLRGQKAAGRVRMLRMPKSGTVKSLKDWGPLLGSSVSQLTRGWERSRAEGSAGLLHQPKPVGKDSRMTSAAWAGSMQQMRAGRIATMQDGRDSLERSWSIRYRNGKEHGWLFKKHRVKWKTGRRRHRKANTQQQAAFKKPLAAYQSHHSASWPSTRVALA